MCIYTHNNDISFIFHLKLSKLSIVSIMFYYSGKEDIVELLVNGGANVNIIDQDKCTPLHKAAGGGYHRAVESLIKAGADVNATEYSGSTPLHWASISGKLKDIFLNKKIKDNNRFNCCIS